MKLKSFIVAVFIIFSVSAFAQWFPARVHVTVLPGQVAAQVFNPFYEPIICGGQVFGQTALGPVYNTFFIEQFLVTGEFRFAYVQTTPFAPFVNGWANINCRFARFF
jgi:hypothetical protein